MEELALSFDDAFEGWVPAIEREGMLPELAWDRVAAVNSAFAALRKVPGNEKWVAMSALSTVPEWILVRESARAALDELGTGGEETDPFLATRTDWVIAGLRQNIDLLAEPPDLQGELLDAYPSAMNSFIIGLHDLLGTFRSRLEAPGGLGPDARTPGRRSSRWTRPRRTSKARHPEPHGPGRPRHRCVARPPGPGPRRPRRSRRRRSAAHEADTTAQVNPLGSTLRYPDHQINRLCALMDQGACPGEVEPVSYQFVNETRRNRAEHARRSTPRESRHPSSAEVTAPR
jgi:hypothetical protein